MGPLFESPPGALLMSYMQPLDRYGTHQKTIVGDLYRCILHLTQGCEWLGEGVIFMVVSNKHRGDKLRLLFKSFPGPLLKQAWGSWLDIVTTRKS